MASLILQTAGRTLFHTIVVFSLFMLFAGHHLPGGGFIGGLIAASALVLRAVAEGPGDLDRLMPVGPEGLLGAGLLAAAGAGVAGLAGGRAFLEQVALDVHLPLVGDLHVTSVLVFDIGVYLIVLGMVHAILRTIGVEESGR